MDELQKWPLNIWLVAATTLKRYEIFEHRTYTDCAKPERTKSSLR